MCGATCTPPRYRGGHAAASYQLSIERDGRILLLQRSQDSTLDPGLWELPGGKMDHGEVLTDALAREVAEETGITVEVGRPRWMPARRDLGYWYVPNARSYG